ncbi:helix-turn-helix transcriptional regulator [Mycetocola saprophilus]|uniref:helix-turn-helix transcriptional regulator n=1 Tax=Mycetocola saprophilus TaxID=76636 RepID=UPI000AB59F4E|nr:helix-turn-helix transcriptional regulator [Mycetocola saprophilus]
MYDALTVGHRIRQRRRALGLTLRELGVRIDRAASRVSVIEHGGRDLGMAELDRIAAALETTTAELLREDSPSARAEREIRLERVQRSPLYANLRLPAVPVRASLSDAAIDAILGLHRELERLHTERAATPEEARRANAALRGDMRARGNYYPDIELVARELLASVNHDSGPLSQRLTGELARHLGFSLHTDAEIPAGALSITDLEDGRIFIPITRSSTTDPRTLILQALASRALGHTPPRDYAEFLRQRVEANYLTGALLIPEADAVPRLLAAKAARELSVEDLRDAFGVGYETAAHRFTNLITRHTQIPVHFLRTHESGVLVKAYENDGAALPSDVLGAVEGQSVCRWWSARRVFLADDQVSPYAQYTDKPAGTFWCTSHIRVTERGRFSLSVGTRFEYTRWFRGRETSHRFTSRCPDPACCRTPPEALHARWAHRTFPAARVPDTLLHALPTGVFPGVDETDVYTFLERRTEPTIESE